MHTFGLVKLMSLKCLFQLFRKALELCLKSYGESSVLSGRLHWNMFVLYEERGEYQEAHTWLVKCKEIREKVGPKVNESVFFFFNHTQLVHQPVLRSLSFPLLNVCVYNASIQLSSFQI